jgi:hypothetical protein
MECIVGLFVFLFRNCLETSINSLLGAVLIRLASNPPSIPQPLPPLPQQQQQQSGYVMSDGTA